MSESRNQQKKRDATEPDEIYTLAELIINELFTAATGERALRLNMELSRGRSAGAWYHNSAAYAVDRVLRANMLHPLKKQHEEDVQQITRLAHERQKWVVLVNRLAHIILQKEITDNDRDEADEAIEKVLPLL